METFYWNTSYSGFIDILNQNINMPISIYTQILYRWDKQIKYVIYDDNLIFIFNFLAKSFEKIVTKYRVLSHILFSKKQLLLRIYDGFLWIVIIKISQNILFDFKQRNVICILVWSIFTFSFLLVGSSS